MNTLIVSNTLFKRIISKNAACTVLNPAISLFVVSSVFCENEVVTSEVSGGAITSYSSNAQVIACVFDSCECGNKTNNQGGNAVYFIDSNLNFHQSVICYCSKKTPTDTQLVGDSPVYAANPNMNLDLVFTYLNFSKNNGNNMNGQVSIESSSESFRLSYSLIDGTKACRVFYIGCKSMPYLDHCNILNTQADYFVHGSSPTFNECSFFNNNKEMILDSNIKFDNCLSDDPRFGSVTNSVLQEFVLCNKNDIESALRKPKLHSSRKLSLVVILELSFVELALMDNPKNHNIMQNTYLSKFAWFW